MYDGNTVCDTEFDNNEGKVSCRDMGLGDLVTWNSGSCPTLVWTYNDNVECSTGSEAKIQNCGKVGYENCGFGYDCVKIECERRPTRLTISGKNGKGFLKFDGLMVCNDEPFGHNFESNEAQVACRELGYEYVESFSKRDCPESFPDFSIKNVECDGTENLIDECIYSTDADSCPFWSCVYVECTNEL